MLALRLIFTGLENRRGGNSTVGSNPTPSANNHNNDLFSKKKQKSKSRAQGKNKRKKNSKKPTYVPAQSAQNSAQKNLSVPSLSDQQLSRLWKKIDRVGQTDCWPWQGAKTNFGHGRVKISGKLYSPHRIVYALECGQIPANDQYHGAVVVHSCDNPACCNPAHLSVGTQKDNVADMVAKGRRASTRRRA